MKDKFGLSAREEITVEVLNAISHGLGVILSIIGSYFLIVKASQNPSQMRWVAYSIYSASMITLFLASTLYHSFSFTKFKRIFQKIDHSAIFLLIAGTYTPYVLLGLNSPYKVVIIGIIWGLALIGIIIEVLFIDKLGFISTLIYLALGWIVIFFIVPLFRSNPLESMILLMVGGFIYSGGTYFYRLKHIKWMHIVWHFCVLFAAMAMFFSIYLYI